MDILGMVCRLDEKSLDALEDACDKEWMRRRKIANLTAEINEKLYELSGLLTGRDSLRFLNNLTGKIETDMLSWDEPERANDYLAPQLEVKINAGNARE